MLNDKIVTIFRQSPAMVTFLLQILLLSSPKPLKVRGGLLLGRPDGQAARMAGAAAGDDWVSRGAEVWETARQLPGESLDWFPHFGVSSLGVSCLSLLCGKKKPPMMTPRNDDASWKFVW